MTAITVKTETMADRKLRILAELNEIETIEQNDAKQQAIVDTQARVNRLLLDLDNQRLACALPIKSVAHVKRIFAHTDATCIMCGFFDTCQEIISLTVKSNIKKTGQVIRKANRERAGRVNTVSFKRTISRGMITLTPETGNALTFKGVNWQAATKQIRDHFKTANIDGLTTSAIAGFTHKGAGNKLECIFNG